MPRTVSEAALVGMLSQQTDQIFLVLLVIDHDSLVQPLRLVNDTQELDTAEGTHLPFPFQPVLPEDGDEAITGITLQVDNVDQRVIQVLRSITSPASVSVSVVLRETPDTVEAGPYEFVTKSAQYNAQSIELTLGYEEDFLNEPFPKDSFTPQTTPGLFR